ncbi:MAG: nucleoside monophosphate kinase [Candidatus Brocadiia bacterium]
MGPTGAGKSPQGARLERRGGFRHFDFGAELRAAGAGRRGLPEADVAFVRRLLAAQALLPDERFDLAQRLLDAFIERARFDPRREVLVLNGLPRHVGQARAIAPRVRVDCVVALECEPQAARARVARRRQGHGSDHPGRPDDHRRAVERKLAVYEQETAPLLAHYRRQPGVRVIRLAVTADTADGELHRRVVGELRRAGLLRDRA